MPISAPKCYGRRVKRRLWVSLFAAWAAGAACSEAPPQKTPAGEPTGRLEFALGAEIYTFDLADARCAVASRDAGSSGQPAKFLNVVVPAAFKTRIAGKPVQPTLISAQLPPSLRDEAHRGEKFRFGRDQYNFGATASAFDVDYEDEVHPSLQIIAQSARDTTEYECSASNEGAKLLLLCNQALVFPWLSAGELPNGSFRATFQCEAAPDDAPTG